MDKIDYDDIHREIGWAIEELEPYCLEQIGLSGNVTRQIKEKLAEAMLQEEKTKQDWCQEEMKYWDKVSAE